MSAECDRVRELAPELALGIADGEQRASALEHLAGCARCRARLERLAATADELALLSPAVEPPAGFEDRVAATMRPAPAQAGIGGRLARPLAAALAAAALAASAVWLALADDRELADSYRETLAVASGESFDASTLELPGGRKAGYVYGYQGRASWVFALVYDGVEPGEYMLELVTRDGERLPLRELVVERGAGSAGAVTPVPYERLAEVRLLDRDGREVADSELRD
jgi:Putative zinc-finger